MPTSCICRRSGTPLLCMQIKAHRCRQGWGACSSCRTLPMLPWGFWVLPVVGGFAGPGHTNQTPKASGGPSAMPQVTSVYVLLNSTAWPRRDHSYLGDHCHILILPKVLAKYPHFGRRKFRSMSASLLATSELVIIGVRADFTTCHLFFRLMATWCLWGWTE